MGKFRCVCGNIISTSGENPDEWLLIPEKEFGLAWDEGEAFSDVYLRMRHLFVCPVSSHVWIFWSGLENSGTCYQPMQSVAADPVATDLNSS
jgi:hypothetical protein